MARPRKKKQPQNQHRSPVLPFQKAPTLVEWKQNKDLVMWASRMFADPNFQLMLLCLRDASPTRAVLARGASGDDVCRAYGEQTGYEMAMSNMLSLAEPMPEPLGDPTFTDN